MPERRSTGHWLQFGILDLFVLTTVAAVVVVLSQPVKTAATKSRPWVFGSWWNESADLFLWPDGYYAYTPQQLREDAAAGVGWTVTPGTDAAKLVLNCGGLRFLIRSDDGRAVLELLGDDGSVASRFERSSLMEGPNLGGTPDGTWSWTDSGALHGALMPSLFLEYRRGELVGLHDAEGTRDFVTLNALRSARGLPAVAQ